MARIKPLADELNREAIQLLDRMLPTEAITVPALPEVAEGLVRAEVGRVTLLGPQGRVT
jgi:hypothetical protein